MNYPVFAYYTGYKTIPLYISDDSFFHDYKSLIKGDGLIIIYKDIKYPGIEWAKYNRELRLVKEYENFSIYEYKNDETNNIE